MICGYPVQDFRGLVGSFAIEQVDSTGAGDAFVGGLLRGIEEDRSALQVSHLKAIVAQEFSSLMKLEFH